MNRNTTLLIFLILLSGIIVGSSCNRKAAFPRDPYRGSTLNKNSHPPKHAKAKDSKMYRSNRK